MPDIAALGPDPLNDGIDVDRLQDRLARTRLPIKVAIMDQTLLPGIGNIQASEGLFRARIDPRRAARSLSRAELAQLARGLLDSIRYTMKTFKQSGADGADADIDYVEERKIPNPFLVYGAGRAARAAEGHVGRPRSAHVMPALQLGGAPRGRGRGGERRLRYASSRSSRPQTGRLTLPLPAVARA
jgi:hypothetical protein